MQQGAQLQMRTAAAHPDAVAAVLHHPALPLRVKGGQLLLRDGDGEGLALAGGQQAGLGKAGQPPELPGPAVLGAGQVDLRRLPAGKADAVVLDRQAHLDGAGLDGQLFKRDRKAGVGQAIPEGKEGLHPETVEPAVADVDPLGVDRLFQVAVQIAEMPGVGVVLVMAGPGGGQLALGRHLAQQDIRHRLAPLLPQLGNLQNGFDMAGLIQQAGQLDRAAGVQQQDDGQALPVQGHQVGALGVAEVVVPFFQPAVLSLAGDAADDIKGSHRAFGVPGGYRAAGGQDKGVGGIGVEGVLHLFCIGEDLFLPGLAGGSEAVFVVGQPVLAGQGNAGGLQPGMDRDIGAVIDIPRTDAALDGVARPGPQQCDPGGGVKRQNASVPEQDDACGGSPAGNGSVGLFPGRGGGVQTAAV